MCPPLRRDELERRLRDRLDALGPAPRAELLHVPMLPDFERVRKDRFVLGNPAARAFDELLTTLTSRSGRCVHLV